MSSVKLTRTKNIFLNGNPIMKKNKDFLKGEVVLYIVLSVIMDRKFCYCVFYTFLLMTITPAMCRRRAKSRQSERSSERRRYAAALLPALSSIAGTAVVPWLFVALLTVYTVRSLTLLAITENTSEDKCYPQNVCASGRGHCRDPTCWSGEFPLWQLADVCGGACPCCVVDYVYEEITGYKAPLGK